MTTVTDDTLVRVKVLLSMLEEIGLDAETIEAFGIAYELYPEGSIDRDLALYAAGRIRGNEEGTQRGQAALVARQIDAIREATGLTIHLQAGNAQTRHPRKRGSLGVTISDLMRTGEIDISTYTFLSRGHIYTLQQLCRWTDTGLREELGVPQEGMRQISQLLKTRRLQLREPTPE